MRRFQGGMSFGPEPTAADLAAAFGLSRTGPGNYNGPCPLCSGDDRFHVHEVDGRAVVGCRGCIDGLAKPERSARYGEVMRLYRGNGQWASAAPIPTDPEHPARRWLAARHLWRPDLQLPPSVRWLEASGGPSVGGLLAAFAPPGHGQPSGVQLVSVDGDGQPAPDRAGPTGLAKRSIGAMRGAVCVLGLPDAVSGVNVAEGLADVLALASRLPWPAICTGGSGGFKNHDLARWLAGLGAVHVWADLDEPDGIKGCRRPGGPRRRARRGVVDRACRRGCRPRRGGRAISAPGRCGRRVLRRRPGARRPADVGSAPPGVGDLGPSPSPS